MSASGRAELYVYYRVAHADLPRALEIVRDFQRGLRSAHAGLGARVLRRPGTGSAEVTLMEVYALDRASGIDETLRTRIDTTAEALTSLLISVRHVEVFETLD
ncbi:MAG TPA: DUF4936 family protein [Burkholderiaceae bacterium]|nr:DUF4936 family protein [Burkholderiaceae bacterium]